MNAGMIIILLLATVLVAVGGYLAQVGEVKDLRAENRALDAENRRLRRGVARTSSHPAARANRARATGAPILAEVGFDRIADAIRALPETSVVLNESTETIEFGGDS